MIPILDVGLKIIEKLIPDKGAREAAQLKLLEMQQSGHLAEMEAKSDIVRAEAASPHVITSAWRPILMLAITAIIVNNYILAPYLSAFFGLQVILELPERLWDLLTIGVGGYVVGRSGEKMVNSWKGKE